MHIVAIGWMFVVLLMAAAEATSTQGSVLGAFITLLFYGVLPLALVLYILSTPARRRALRRRELAAAAPDGSGTQTDGGGHAAGDPVAPVGKEP